MYSHLCCIILTLSALAAAQVSLNFTELVPPPDNNFTNRNCSVTVTQLACRGSYILSDGDTGPIQGVNLSRAFAWGRSFNMTFMLSPQSNVSQVTLFFTNQPSSGIGLPGIDGLFWNISNPLNFTLAGNQYLSQNDTGQRNVSLIITSNVSRYSSLRVRFSFSSSILERTLILSELRLSNIAVSPPVMRNISFLSQPSVITLGAVSPLASYNISCTVMNEGSFVWNWTLPASPIQYQMWIADGTRTTVLQLSHITSDYSGNYVCAVKYRSQTTFVANSTIKVMINITRTTSIWIGLASSPVLQLGLASSPVLQPGPTSQEAATGGSLAAGLVVGIIIIIILVAVLVILFALVYYKRYKKQDPWIAEQTFRDVQTNEPKDLEAKDPDQNNHTDVVTMKPQTISAWKEQKQSEYETQDSATDEPSSEGQKRVLIGPSKAGALAQITDVSGFTFTTNPRYEADEGEESSYENIDITKHPRSKKVPIRRIKPVDIQYEMGNVVATVPAQNLISIPEVLSPSSPPSEQGAERKRCLTGPSKPGRLATTSEVALQNMMWYSNALYSSGEYNLPPLDRDPLEHPDSVYSVVMDPSMSTQHHETSLPAQDIADLPCSSIYENLSDCGFKPLEISPENIHEIELLGEGQYGEVLLAELVDVNWKCLGISVDGDGRDSSATVRVSVKRLKEHCASDALGELKKEIKFMSSLNNENVVRLLAIHGGSEGSAPFIVMEYMENGDLCKFLQNQQMSFSHEENCLLLLHMATQIANGMRYLASFNFVHRDLATRNCLVGKNYIVKISDFGMATNLYESAYCRIHGQAKLPIRWMPTESFYGQFSEKSDVWSFGVVMWEIYSLARALPYAEMEDDALIEDATLGQARTLLTAPTLCPPEVYDIMIWCWSHAPADRPTFEEVHQALLHCQN